MAKKLVIFGIGKIGQVAYHHFSTDSDYTVAGFCADREYLPATGEYAGLPAVAFEEAERRFAPRDHAMFVAVGYQRLNRLRAERFAEAKKKGYAAASYVSSQNKHCLPSQIGENCFVMSGEPIQPHAKIGDDCFIWTNALIGHHSVVGNHCWIVSGATIGGHSRIGDDCFLGLNATVGHEVNIGARSLLGAGTLITRDAPEESVFIAPDTPRYRLTSEQFLKMATLK